MRAPLQITEAQQIQLHVAFDAQPFGLGDEGVVVGVLVFGVFDVICLDAFRGLQPGTIPKRSRRRFVTAAVVKGAEVHSTTKVGHCSSSTTVFSPSEPSLAFFSAFPSESAFLFDIYTHRGYPMKTNETNKIQCHKLRSDRPKLPNCLQIN